MKITKTVMALGASALLLGASAMTFAQEDEDGHILEITRVGLKIGHGMKFRESLKPYHECLTAGEYDGSWSAWQNVDGDPNVYHFVSTMNNWAEMDKTDEAAQTCWAEHYQEITAHADSVSISFARYLPAWSGEHDDFSVVRLHQFRVEDNDQFEETVGDIISILKESEYEDLGAWYEVIGSDSNEPNYFVVEHYANFAAIDEDLSGPYKAVSDAEGQERAEELFDQFDDTLRDDGEYSSELLRRVDELSHDGGE